MLNYSLFFNIILAYALQYNFDTLRKDCIKETTAGIRNKINKAPQSSRRGETNQS
jgi:hypothetical protein